MKNPVFDLKFGIATYILCTNNHTLVFNNLKTTAVPSAE